MISNSWISALLAVALVVALHQGVAAEEFGHFGSDPKGSWVSVPNDRPLFALSEDFVYFDPVAAKWTAPSGTRVDGASIPRVFWTLIGGPFEGGYLNASIIHDYYCVSHERSSAATHLAFYYGMRAGGVGWLNATVMYWAVVAANSSWSEQQRIVERQTCTTTGPVVTCSTTSEIVKETVVTPGLDLADPTIRALLESKLVALAKTLKTSNGETLDIGPSGRIEASIDSVAQSAEAFANLIKTNQFEVSPERLGLMARVTELVPLDEVAVWPDSQLPQFSGVRNLSDTNSNKTLDGGFQLKQGDLKLLKDGLNLSPRTFDFETALPK